MQNKIHFQDTKKTFFIYIYAIGFGVNFRPINNNDHVSSLYFFCKGQVST